MGSRYGFGGPRKSRAARQRLIPLFCLTLVAAIVFGQTGLLAQAAGPELPGATAGQAVGPNAAAALDAGDVSLDFLAAGPFTYDHGTGVGGAFDDRTISKTDGVVESLEGGDFACGDLVVFFTAITVEPGDSAGAVDLDYTYDGATTSGSPVGFNDIISASINSPDSGNENLDGNESATILSEQFVTQGPDRLETSIRVEGVDGGDQIILRMVVRLACALDPGNITGNIQSTLDHAEVVGGQTINSGEQTVPLKQAGDILIPGLNVQKSCPATATVGDTITYTITVTNSGQDTLNGLTVQDSILGDLSGDFPDTLSAGQVVVRNFEHELDASPDPITNVVTVAATANQTSTAVSDTADCTTDVLFPDLEIDKTADQGTVSAGDTIGYTITVTNSGAGNAYGVVMTDTLPTNAGLNWTFNQVTGGWNCAIAAGVLTCGGPNFDLGPGDSASVHLSSPTTSATCGQVANQASVSASNQVTVTSDIAYIVVDCAELNITKIADDGVVDAGDDIGYLITVTNGGAGVARDVTLTDTLPSNAGLSWTIDGGTGAADCEIAGGVLSCDFGDLASGASRSVHISSPTTAASCGVVSNTAFATTSNDGSPSAGPVNILVNCPDLSVLKTADQGTIDAGDTAAFTIVVENEGDGLAKDVTLTDQLPGGVAWQEDSDDCEIAGGVLSCDFGDLAGGDSRTIHVWGDTDAADCGELVNVATVAASNESDDDLDDNASEATIVVECPGISVVKEADDDAVDAGELIGFTITVANAGPGLAKDVVLTDTLPTNDSLGWSVDGGTGAQDCLIDAGVLTCEFGDMEANTSTTVHLSSDTDFRACGTVDNTAVVTIANGDGDEDDASISVNCPDLGIQIVKDGWDKAHVGDTVEYTFDVSLTTAEPLYNVTVVDPNCNEGAPVYESGDDGDAVLEPGEVWSYSCTHLVTEDDPDPLPNVATVTGDSDDGRQVSDEDDHEVDLIHPDIRIRKTVNPISGEPGDIVTYTYEVTNTGDTTLYDVTVDDDVIGHIGVIDELLPGDTVVLTKDWELPAEDITVVNVGTATGTDELDEEVSDTDDANVTIVLAEEPPTAFTGGEAMRYGTYAAILMALGAIALAVAGRRRKEA